MRRPFVCPLALVLWLLAAGALPAFGAGQGALDAARRDYAAGNYAAAAASYVVAARADAGLVDVPLCLDAATASRLAGDSGRAAWWLYRASRLAPDAAAVRSALAAAGLEADAAAYPLASALPPRLLWRLVLWTNALFWLGLAGARLARMRLPRRAVAAAAVCLAGLWLWVGWATLAPVLLPRGVALRAAAAASAPEAGAETLFSVASGTVVAVGPSRDGFVRVETRGPGAVRAGWVVGDVVARLPR